MKNFDVSLEESKKADFGYAVRLPNGRLVNAGLKDILLCLLLERLQPTIEFNEDCLTKCAKLLKL